MITAVLVMAIANRKQFNIKNIVQVLIFIACIGLSRIVEIITSQDETLTLDVFQLFIVRSVAPLIIFMGLEYLLSFEIRQDKKLGFRSIMSGIQVGLIGLLWFREITEGSQDLFMRNLIANVVFLIIGFLLFLEIGVSFLEKRTLIELFS